MKNLKNKIKNIKGITLISLVVTIIILIIISSVSIGIILGNNGLTGKAKTAKEEYQSSIDDENKKLEEIYSKLLIANSDSSSLENIDMITLKKLILDSTYPVGSIYVTIEESNPTNIIGGIWEKIEEGKVLQTVKSSQTVGTTVDAGLPNITGSWVHNVWLAASVSGAFANSNSGTLGANTYSISGKPSGFSFDASRVNRIYGNSDTVQPPAYLVYMWKRTK